MEGAEKSALKNMKKNKGILEAWHAWADNYNKYFRKDYIGEKTMTINELKKMEEEYENKMNELYEKIKEKYYKKITEYFKNRQPEKEQFYKELKKLLKDNYLTSVCDFDEENYEIQYEEFIFNWGDIWVNGRKIGEFKSPETCLKIIKAIEEE